MNKWLKKLGTKGLIMVGLFCALAIVCLWAAGGLKAVVLAVGSGVSIPLVFGTARATYNDGLYGLQTMKYTHNAILIARQVIVVDGFVLIAVNASEANVENVFICEGRVEMPKENPLVISSKDALYWDESEGVVTKTALGNTLCGYCQEDAASTDDVVIMKLQPQPVVLDAGDIVFSAGQLLVGQADASGAAKSVSGDITIDADGVVTIGAKKVLASMTAIADGKLLVGGADGAGAAQTPSGDVTMSNAGAFTLKPTASMAKAAIADPGDGEAIPVTASGVCAITIGSAGAETNTLAAPSALGMLLAITAAVVGTGTRAVTCATTVNQTGNNTLTFAAAGDTILLYSTLIGADLRWRVASNDGVALSTV